MNRIFGLDLMRSFAITFVLLGHGWFLLGDIGQLTQLAKSIFVFGVEIFFVLSGFLIGGILLRDFEKSFKIHDILHFWKRRWFRTLPNYLLFLLINILGFSLLTSSFTWDWQYLFFLQNFAWMPEKFFSVSWSLAIEEWFYLIIPVAIYSFKKFPLKLAALMVIFSIISICIILRLHGAIYHGYLWNEELRLVTIYRLDSLMYGVFAAWLKHYKNELFISTSKLTLFTGILFTASAIIFKYSGLIESSPIIASLCFPISCIGFMCFLPSLDNWYVNQTKYYAKFVYSISAWSYSLYLVHVPLLEVVKILARKVPIMYQFPFNIIVILLWLSTSVFISFFIFTYFEKPMMKLRDKSFFTKGKNLKQSTEI
jgi:peptidoglycan/LPS O-acetylase OafA/YrhL